MSMLVALEPPVLRRILKAGLRQGISDGDMRQLIRDALVDSKASEPDREILEMLQMRGWLNCEHGRWKTKLG
jgi:hypothetical protein